MNWLSAHSLPSKGDLEAFFYNHPSVISLQKRIGYSFKKRELLFCSMLHRSFVNEFPKIVISNNEKLEFLGDSILGAIVATDIYAQFDSLNEGQLSKLKGALVNEDALSELAELIMLSKTILLGKGEYKTGGLSRSSILSDAFEALIGAIYLDGGIVSATNFLHSVFSLFEQSTGKRFINSDRLDNFDSKTKLQEMTMKLYKSLPEYKSIQNEDSSFTVELYINGKAVAKVTDISKKRAQKELATLALTKELYKGE